MSDQDTKDVVAEMSDTPVTADPLDELLSSGEFELGPDDSHDIGDEVEEPVEEAEEEVIEEVEEPEEAAEEEVEEVEEVEAAEEDAGPVSRGWAEIKKKDRMLLEKDTALKQRELQLQQKEQELRQFDTEKTELINTLRQNPIAGLAKLGINFDDLTAQVLNGEVAAPKTGNPQDNALLDKIDKLEARLTSMTQETTINQQIKEFKGEVSGVLAQPKYESLKAFGDDGAMNKVLDLVGLHYQNTGITLTAAQAADMIKDEWEQQLKSLPSNQAVRRVLGLQGDTPTDTTAADTQPNRPKRTATPTISSRNSPKTFNSTEEDDDSDPIFSAMKRAEKAAQKAGHEIDWGNLKRR